MITRKIPDMLRRWLLRRAINIIASRPADYVIGAAADPVLERWHVLPRNPIAGIYAHVIRKPDPSPLHDHPYASISIILRGAYAEHQPSGAEVRQAGDVVIRRADALHRIEPIRHAPVITLFLVGPRVRAWGFACRDGWRPYHEVTEVVDGVSNLLPGCEP